MYPPSVCYTQIYVVMRNKVEEHITSKNINFPFTSYAFLFEGPFLGTIADIVTERIFS